MSVIAPGRRHRGRVRAPPCRTHRVGSGRPVPQGFGAVAALERDDRTTITSAFRIAFRARQATEWWAPGKRLAVDSHDAHPRVAGGGGPFTRYPCAPDRCTHVTVMHRAVRENGGRLGTRGEAIGDDVPDVASHHTWCTRPVAGARELAAVGGIIRDDRSSRALLPGAGHQGILTGEQDTNRGRGI